MSPDDGDAAVQWSPKDLRLVDLWNQLKYDILLWKFLKLNIVSIFSYFCQNSNFARVLEKDFNIFL